MSQDALYGIGIDLGGTRLKIAAVTRSGQELAFRSFETCGAEGAVWLQRAREAIQSLETEFGAAPVAVAAPGLCAADGRSIHWMQGRLEGMQGLDWTSALSRSERVPVLNDAHAALLGESWIGAGVGVGNLVLLTLGTGVGGAAMIDGRLLRGALGRAGHFGHISIDALGERDIVGTPGSLEDAIGECSLRRRGDGRFLSTKDLLAAFNAGDPFAAKIWQASLKALAAGIVSIVNSLSPELILLGGGISHAGESLLGPLALYLDAIEWRPHGFKVAIKLAALGQRAGAFGAACHAMTEEQ